MCGVLQPGELKAGDEIRLVRRPSPQWSIARFNGFILRRSATIDEMNELIQLEGLAEEWRQGISHSLQDG